MKRGWRLHAVAFTALAGAACYSSAAEPGPVASIGGADATATPSPTESVAVDVEDDAAAAAQDWTVPDEITVEYVERVLTELERLLANFDRWLIDSEPYEEIPDDVEADFLSVYHHLTGPQLLENVWASYGEDETGRPFARRPFGQAYPEDLTLLGVLPGCVVLETDWDTSETVLEGGVSRRKETIVLVPLPPAQVHRNDTGWVIGFSAPSDEVEEDDLAGTLAGGAPCDG